MKLAHRTLQKWSAVCYTSVSVAISRLNGGCFIWKHGHFDIQHSEQRQFLWVVYNTWHTSSWYVILELSREVSQCLLIFPPAKEEIAKNYSHDVQRILIHCPYRYQQLKMLALLVLNFFMFVSKRKRGEVFILETWQRHVFSTCLTVSFGQSYSEWI